MTAWRMEDECMASRWIESEYCMIIDIWMSMNGEQVLDGRCVTMCGGCPPGGGGPFSIIQSLSLHPALPSFSIILSFIHLCLQLIYSSLPPSSSHSFIPSIPSCLHSYSIIHSSSPSFSIIHSPSILSCSIPSELCYFAKLIKLHSPCFPYLAPEACNKDQPLY